MADRFRIFVVLDPTCMEQAALMWGEQIAQTFIDRDDNNVMLHVYCCINAESVAVASAESESVAREETGRRVSAWIERLVAAPRAQGLEVEVEVEWNDDWRSAIVTAANRQKSSLVVKNMTQHSRFVRMIRETSDWTLIRKCESPVLLVKTGRLHAIEKILVAVKYDPENEIYEKANDRILDAARRLTANLGATMHVVTAYPDTGSHPDRQRFADRCGLDRSQVSADMGAPEKVIADTAERQGCDLVMIARVASPESRKDLGGTARRVIDGVDVEVLVLPVSG